MMEKITLEDVLDELMIEEENPDYATLVRWQQTLSAIQQGIGRVLRHLEHAGAACRSPSGAGIDEEKAVNKGVEYAMRILRQQGRIVEKAEAEAPLQPFDQLVLTAIYLIHGTANVVNVSEKVGEMQGKEVLLASTFASLDRLEQRHLIMGLDADPKTEPGGRHDVFHRHSFGRTRPGRGESCYPRSGQGFRGACMRKRIRRAWFTSFTIQMYFVSLENSLLFRGY